MKRFLFVLTVFSFIAAPQILWADNPEPSLEEVYQEQAKQLDSVEQELESAYEAGRISSADYEVSKKSLAETREFIETNGKSLGPEMVKLQEMADPIIAAHKECQDLESDPTAYQGCLQSHLS